MMVHNYYEDDILLSGDIRSGDGVLRFESSSSEHATTSIIVIIMITRNSQYRYYL